MEISEINALIRSLDYLNSSCSDVEEFCVVLKKLTTCSKDETQRQSLTDTHWNVMLKTAERCNTILEKGSRESKDSDFIAELLRCLRNACIGFCCHDEPNKSKPLLSVVFKVLPPLLKQRSASNDEDAVILQLCLQLLGNIVCQSHSSRIIVWNFFRINDAFRILLKDGTLKVQEYMLMVLYNCVNHELQRLIITTTEGQNVLELVTDSLLENTVDWGILLLEFLITQESNFMEMCYIPLPTKNRLLVLDVFAEMLDNSQDLADQSYIHSVLNHVKKLFVEYVMDIVKSCESDSDDLKSVEIMKLLSILCSASLLKQHTVIKTSPDLLEVAIDTLKSVHLLGKQSCNSFSSISKLKNSEGLSKEDIESHPTFGFKKSLIRLIANMCCGSKQNQDLVRQLDGIPLLLDCCNIDIRNPYIIQWCVLALKNLLEKNQENQAVVASLSITGDLVDSALLRELGLKLHMEGNKPVLQSLGESSNSLR